MLELQSVNLWQAFFQRQAVHHMSRFSIPYTLRHFLPSPRTFRLENRWRSTGEQERVSRWEPEDGWRGGGGGVSYLSAAVALGGDESAAMVWERCSPKPWLLLGDTCGDQRLEILQEEHTHTHRPHTLTMLPVNVTGGDCQEMLKLELLVGVKLVQAEPLLVLLEGMETGGVAWGAGGEQPVSTEDKKNLTRKRSSAERVTGTMKTFAKVLV